MAEKREGTAFQSTKSLGFTEKNSNNIFCINNSRWQKTNINGKNVLLHALQKQWLFKAPQHFPRAGLVIHARFLYSHHMPFDKLWSLQRGTCPHPPWRLRTKSDEKLHHLMVGHSYRCTLLENKKLLGKSRGVKHIMAAGCWKHMTKHHAKQQHT